MHFLHEKALRLAKEFRKVELELLEVLREIDAELLFRKLGYTSLFDYATRALKLSVSQAKRVTAVIDSDNAIEWIGKAQTLTQRELEKEVAKANPKAAVRESVKYISGERLELKMGISEAFMKKLRRAQDLESQRTRAHCDYEKTLEGVLDLYLERKDPLQKRGRQLKESPSSRNELERALTPAHVSAQPVQPVPIPTHSAQSSASPVHSAPPVPIPIGLRREVHRQDASRCTYIYPDGQRCVEQRWLDLHHLTPVSQGGENLKANLAILCSAHHQFTHA